MNKDRLPRHIAFIMDGNGRWAARRDLPRVQGHRKGADTVDLLTDISLEKNIEAITFYAFSCENWSRPQEEIEALMKLLREGLRKRKKDLFEKDIRFVAIGELDMLPDALKDELAELEEKTRLNKKMTLSLALSYGSRQEILNAAIRMCDAGTDPSFEPSVERFSEYLYTKDLPELDLLIRTSGEKRLSNFLLWQAAYAELYFTETLWPDFGREEYLEALSDFARRERRFGG